MFALKPVTRRTRELVPRAENFFGWMPAEFETLFNRLFPTMPLMATPDWEYPWGLTTEENEKEFVVRVELPGFAAEELKVEITGETLTVEAAHKAAEATGEKVEKKAEPGYAALVKRVVTLPENVELEKIEAVYRNGVLEVHLPRKPDAAARGIEVKT